MPVGVGMGLGRRLGARLGKDRAQDQAQHVRANAEDKVQPSPGSQTPPPAYGYRAGRNPFDKQLTELIGELSTRSETFRTRRAAHNVRLHRTGIKHFHHPVAGDLDLTFRQWSCQLTRPSL
jgi:hypothetical protein